jgi:hypothetical protein
MKDSKLYLVLVVGVLFILSTSFVKAWTDPIAVPPGGNTPAPINVGSVQQNKQGMLSLGGLGVFGPGLVTPTAGYLLPPKLIFGVNGSLGAKEYCDEKGQNCVKTLGDTVVSGQTSSGAPIVGGSCGTENAGVRFKGYNNRTSQDVTYCCYLWSGGAVSGGYHDGLDRHIRCDIGV